MYSTVNKTAFVALVGAPNGGKTSLFNILTGSHYDTVNYPGNTVEFSVGTTLNKLGPSLKLMDTPGTYSLFPKSQDEEVCVDALFDGHKVPHPDVVVAVIDATQLSRYLILVDQLQLAGFNLVVALTMNDLLKENDQELNHKLLAQRLRIPVIPINSRTGEGTATLMKQIYQSLPEKKTTPTRLTSWPPEQLRNKMRSYKELADHVTMRPKQNLPIAKAKPNPFQKLDRWLLHPITGLLAFAGIMMALFTSIFWAATPLMDVIDLMMSTVASYVVKLGSGTLWADFLATGVIGVAGAIIIFVPQIFILFLGLTYLESTGYLARAASLVDRPLAKLGLNGRAFVPLLSGFACAVPAMMAARTIANKKERWLTLFIIPLMTCSARLPVFALLLAFIFRGEPAWQSGLMMTMIYFASLVVGAIAAMMARRFIPADAASFFMMELPAYRRPQWRTVLKTVRQKTWSFVRNAGPIIFILSIVIWAGTTFPKYDLPNAEERMRSSYAAQVGQMLEPVFEPMGGDWRTGVGLLSAFAAREVFVSSLAVMFNVTADDETSLQNSLLASMQQAKAPDGLPLFTIASISGLILFFMIALQCMSTVAIARREFGNWRDPILQLVLFNVVAYLLAVGVVQGLRSIGIA